MAKKSDLEKTERGRGRLTLWISLAVAVIIVIATLMFLIKTFNDPKNLALSISDVPLGFVPDPAYTGYKTGNYWQNETQKQYAMENGFKNGYYNNFIYLNQITGVFTGISSSVSIYNPEDVVEVYNHTKSSILENNCTPFDAPGKWINSFGCYYIYNSSIGEVKEYQVLFYKGNVIAGVNIMQNDTSADLSGSVVKYAQIVADKI